MNIFESHHHSDTSSSSETSSSNRNNTETFLPERPKKRTGRRVLKETRHPVYRGIRKRNNNKWVSEMRVPNRNKCSKSRIWLGTYATPEMAARAHDVAALVLKGKSACLNFADSAWRLRLPESNDADEIRKAAMEAAELVYVEDNNQCEVSVGDGVVMEDSNDKHDMIEQVPTEFDDMHDLLLSIANEPLRSPSPSITDYATNWFDMEMFDTQVSSLWDFSDVRN
ncbi:dehydration-responsive element-binding protein 1E-like [Vicia villosa]|uniref:dehydration-responsive element-binding protein 1E-like n=1 Tax=Vicia villosa TaxID=3911 RepID=UPI00273BB7B7|nr:dehydration-responsive element-binding protein 1E-like [Vicia villosa]